MMDNLSVTVQKCMDTLKRQVGTVELEAFIYYVRSQNFDYTKWQREHYDSLTADEIYSSLQEYSKTHTFHAKKAEIL